jgi:hypothetical protein
MTSKYGETQILCFLRDHLKRILDMKIYGATEIKYMKLILAL